MVTVKWADGTLQDEGLRHRDQSVVASVCLVILRVLLQVSLGIVVLPGFLFVLESEGKQGSESMVHSTKNDVPNKS